MTCASSTHPKHPNFTSKTEPVSYEPEGREFDYHQDQTTMSAMHNPAHPGEVLREYLPDGLSIGEVAKRLGVTRQALSAVLNGRAGVSAAMALRLEGALGTSAEMWLGMQANHDLWVARKRPPKVRRLPLAKLAA
jgi:addiction module HigA family antidote